jgi:hypothetical protein
VLKPKARHNLELQSTQAVSRHSRMLTSGIEHCSVSSIALEDTEQRLTSDGAFETEPSSQLAALALRVDISIEDLARPRAGYLLGF